MLRRSCSICLLLVLTASCSRPQPERPAVRVQPVAAPLAAAVDVEKPAKPVRSDTHEATPEQAVEPVFVTPFPDRTELFAPPDRRSGGAEAAYSDADDVVLKGFASVGQLGALLVIDGRPSVVHEGDTVNGILVIAIEPPRVTLQRRNRTWVADLVKTP